MALGEFVLPLVGAGAGHALLAAALGAQVLLLPLALAGALVLADTRSKPARRATRASWARRSRQPGMPGVLTAGFLRFVCKFALVAYLPLLLVDRRGASLTQAALVLSVASGVAAAVNFLVVRLLRRMPASRLLGAAAALVGVSLAGFALAPNWQVALAVAVVFGIGDGMLTVVQNALVTEAAPAGVRAGLVAVSGMTRNAGKLAGAAGDGRADPGRAGAGGLGARRRGDARRAARCCGRCGAWIRCSRAPAVADGV